MNLQALKILNAMSNQPGRFKVEAIQLRNGCMITASLRTKDMLCQLHSVESPAVFITYLDINNKVVSYSEQWYLDGRAHRPTGPADTTYDSNFNPVIQQYWHNGFRYRN